MNVSSLTKTIIKKDLEHFATIDDLKKIATKGDFKKFGLRIQIKQFEKNLRGDILKLEAKLEVLQEGQKDIKRAIVKLQNTMDKFVGEVDNLMTQNQGACQTPDRVTNR